MDGPREPRSKVRHQGFHPFAFGPRFGPDPLMTGLPFKLPGKTIKSIFYESFSAECSPPTHACHSHLTKNLAKNWEYTVNWICESFLIFTSNKISKLGNICAWILIELKSVAYFELICLIYFCFHSLRLSRHLYTDTSCKLWKINFLRPITSSCWRIRLT